MHPHTAVFISVSCFQSLGSSTPFLPQLLEFSSLPYSPSLLCPFPYPRFSVQFSDLPPPLSDKDFLSSSLTSRLPDPSSLASPTSSIQVSTIHHFVPLMSLGVSPAWPKTLVNLLTSSDSADLRVDQMNSMTATKTAMMRPQISTTKIPPMFSMPKPEGEHN